MSLGWHNREVPEPVEPSVPFRWDLVTPDQLGSLLTGTDEPRLWFLDDLTACAGKVLARSGNGDLLFVGRSLDSLFDLLSGVLAGTDWGEPEGESMCELAPPAPAGRRAIAPSSCAD